MEKIRFLIKWEQPILFYKIRTTQFIYLQQIRDPLSYAGPKLDIS